MPHSTALVVKKPGETGEQVAEREADENVPSNPHLTNVERAEAEKVLAATTDLTLGAGLVLRPSRRAKDDVERPAYLIFRFTAPDSRRREMGLGAIQRTNPQEIAQRLSQARVEVAGYREQLRQGIDPLEHKNAERERARRVAGEEGPRADRARDARPRGARVSRARDRAEPHDAVPSGGARADANRDRIGRSAT